MLEDAGFDVIELEDMGDSVIENARILARARLFFLWHHPRAAGVPDDILRQWDRQLKSLSDAWLKGYFSIIRLFAQKR